MWPFSFHFDRNTILNNQFGYILFDRNHFFQRFSRVKKIITIGQEAHRWFRRKAFGGPTGNQVDPDWPDHDDSVTS